MLEPRVGTTVFARYVLEKELAKGAMGSVWVARDTRLKRQVAVKTLKGNWADSSDAKVRFEREAMAVAKLNSPYIVQIFDYGVDNQCPFIAMELLEGEDFRTRLGKDGRIELSDLVPIVVQTAKALSVAHQAGIVHRDLKPGNLFLVKADEEELVKVLDFGVAKATEESQEERPSKGEESTKAGTLLGTPAFMSPEQARGVKGIDHRADLWSLGVIIFRALTGKLPFAGATVADTIVKLCSAPVPKATSLVPELAPEVETFFARALARKPAARFKTARELASAFARIDPRASAPSFSTPSLSSEVQQAALEAQESEPGVAPSAFGSETDSVGALHPGGIAAAVTESHPAEDEEPIPPSSGGLFEMPPAEPAASDGSLGSQSTSMGAVADERAARQTGRAGVIFGVVAALVAVALGAVLLLSNRDQPPAEPAGRDRAATAAAAAAPTTTAAEELPPKPTAAPEPPATTAAAEPTTEPSASSAATAAAPATPPPRLPTRRPPSKPKGEPDDKSGPKEDTYDSRY
ncbi:MAG: protein kinase [Deltaproteobacteria bacterium]|jgi:serine/threonine-protein kinase|nr:protein kinase [Deltaproteobacteria bacterium]MBW2535288.1 protein kinase [Deltaproteobacteria bacterium]